MESSFRIARIAGVEVGAHWSWLIIVALVTWSLAAVVFPDTTPGLSDGTYVAMAFTATVLFFVSLLLHELGHAVRARKEGMDIDGITLWVFGGIARFQGRFPSAGAELRIALAGPAVTVVIGALCLATAAALPMPDAVSAVVFWLGYINVVLLVFNMLPALPLDGGRVLRALLWRRRGDFQSATRSAAALGRGFGQFMIAGGVFLFLVGAGLGGIWLAFIGWFVIAAAEMELRAAQTERALAGLRARDVMVADPVVVDPDVSLDRFMDDVFFKQRHVAYPVCDHGRPVGLISFRSVLDTERDEWPRLRVRDRMLSLEDAPSFAAEDQLDDALRELLGSELRRGLVLDGERLAGLLSVTDAARVLEARGGDEQVAVAQAPGR